MPEAKRTAHFNKMKILFGQLNCSVKLADVSTRKAGVVIGFAAALGAISASAVVPAP